jgi:hypothetical protein
VGIVAVPVNSLIDGMVIVTQCQAQQVLKLLSDNLIHPGLLLGLMSIVDPSFR